MGCGGLVPGKSEQFGTIGTVFGSGPEWQTVHGGVTTAGGAVGAGPSIVVEGAPQLEAIVAGPGPTWIGLQAGNLSRSSEKCSSATLNFIYNGVHPDIDLRRPRALLQPACNCSWHLCLVL